MKGTFFQKPFEFNLKVEGETWRQGDPVSGSLTVKNHGPTATQEMNEVRVQLVRGELKKVRAKSADAFTPLTAVKTATASPVQKELAAGNDLSFPWSFETDRNCQITDSLGSLFVIYGYGQADEKIGQLQLNFEPFGLIQDFLQIVTIQFRFVIKSRKSRKGAVEVKLSPPTSKNFLKLEGLTLTFRMSGEDLEVEYGFNLKKMEASAAGVEINKEKKELVQTYAPHEYRIPSGRLNHERLEAGIQEALNQM